ncbi:MAG: PilN domain-containing protein [Bacteroidota bacterium]
MITISINLIGDRQSDSLLPFKNIDEDMIGLALLFTGGFLAAVILPLILNFMIDSILISRVTRETERLQGVLGKSSGELQQIGKMRERLKALEGEYDMLKTLVGQGAIWPSILDELRTLVPTDMWITGISIAGNTLKIDAKTLNYRAVAYFYANLQNAKNFNTPVLGPIGMGAAAADGEDAKVKTPGQKIIDFSVTCTVSTLKGTSLRAPATKPAEEGAQ